MLGMQEVDAGEVVNNMHPGHHAFFFKVFSLFSFKRKGKEDRKRGGETHRCERNTDQLPPASAPPVDAALTG